MKTQLKKRLPRPIINILKKTFGLFYTMSPTVFLRRSYNNYSEEDRKMSILPKQFNSIKATELCHIMKGHGSDKALFSGVSEHNYTTFYYAALKRFQNKSIRLFEIGIGSIDPTIMHNMGLNGKPGASLRGWRDFFPLGRVFGADIDTTILFEEERIKTYYIDQTNPGIIKEMWAKNTELFDQFDIIIDDGLHTFDANVCLYENSIAKLKAGGVYIIEDVAVDELGKWKKLIKDTYLDKYPHIKFSILQIPNGHNFRDNNLIVIEKLREYVSKNNILPKAQVNQYLHK